MKFLAWFFAVIVFLSSFFVIFAYNLHQTFLTPEKTKETLVKVDFYNQIKSVLKKDLFENSNSDTKQINIASKAITASLEQFDFQPKIETLISDFYQGLKQKGGFTLTIDLADFKKIFLSNLLGSADQKSVNELSASIPSSWKIDMAAYTVPLAVISVMYDNYLLILIIFAVLTSLFFLFCLLINFKYLKLFFWVFIIVGFFTAVQLVLWKVINISSLLANIKSQGQSGVDTLIENFINYFRQANIGLLFWEAICLIGISLIGLIVVSVIPSKISNVPLHEPK